MRAFKRGIHARAHVLRSARGRAGGESVYGEPFKDEIHSRLHFNHRGQVAMANTGKANDNGSQFFITLDKCPWLDRKHTIFGKARACTTRFCTVVDSATAV